MFNGHLAGGVIMIAGALGIGGLVAQVVVDANTLIPAGVAIVAMIVLVRVTWKLSQIHTEVLRKLEKLDEKHLELDEKHLRNFRRIVQLQTHMQEMVEKIMDRSEISYHGIDVTDLQEQEEAEKIQQRKDPKPPDSR